MSEANKDSLLYFPGDRSRVLSTQIIMERTKIRIGEVADLIQRGGESRVSGEQRLENDMITTGFEMAILLRGKSPDAQREILRTLGKNLDPGKIEYFAKALGLTGKKTIGLRIGEKLDAMRRPGAAEK